MKENRPWGIMCLAASVLVAAHVTLAQAAAKTTLQIEDLYRFDGPKSSVLFPDGKRAVYVRQWIDAATKQERQSLWIVEGPGENARPLEPGEPDAQAPLVSPNGKWIVFLSTRARPKGWKQILKVPLFSDAATDIWVMPAAGGPALPLAGTDKPYGRVFSDPFYGRVAFSPDGKSLVFVADDGVDPRTPEEIANDVRIVRPDQGEGYTGYGPAQIWIAELDEDRLASQERQRPRGQPFAVRRIDRLTNDDVWYGDPQWSPDGKMIAVHANKTNDRESVRYSINKNYDIWAIDAATKRQTQLTTGPGPEVSPRWSPDGTRLVCLSDPRKGTHRDLFNLAVVHLGASGSRTEILFNHHGPQADKPPHPAPLFPLPEKCWLDSGHVMYNGEARSANVSVILDVKSGKAAHYSFADPRTGESTKRLEPGVPSQRLLPTANAFLQDRLVAESKVITWSNGEGTTIEGFLTLPPAAVAQPPYKLILHPHGGPHGRSAPGFDFTVQVFAARGYAVFQPNYRGSSGYGQKFLDADRGDFGGGDMRDILSGIDHLVKEKIVDPRRQFVYGVSYGGFMTCWLVGHTKQFRAAVAQNAVTDLNMMWGLSDLQSWVQWEFGGYPWEVPAALAEHSPLTYAGNIQTPTMIQYGSDDRRCPLPMGKAFHQALLARNVPTQMVIYPNENHYIRQPRHREDMYRRVLAWFAKYDNQN